MKQKKCFYINVLLGLISFTIFISPVLAGFELGDSSLPIDEEGFIVYEKEWEDEVASALASVEVKFVDIYQFHEAISGIGVNITVREKNSTSNIYNIVTVNNIRYQNLTCLLYNKTQQYFIYNQLMNNLLVEGYGGYYVIPNDPVDVNLVKIYVESNLGWTTNVNENILTIDITNVQVVLTYNEQGILAKEEVKINNETVSTLTLIEQNDNNLIFIIIISLISIFGAFAVIIPVIILHYRRSK
jgi:hypothetical protein